LMQKILGLALGVLVVLGALDWPFRRRRPGGKRASGDGAKARPGDGGGEASRKS
jgi:hypothetical protein